MGKNIAVEGCSPQDITGSGTVKIESQPSNDVLAGGKKAYFGTINVSVKGSNGGGLINNNNGQGPGTIKGTGSNVLGNGQPAVLEGDTGTATVTGTNTVGNTTTTVTTTVTVKITNAGQTDVIAL